MRVVPLLALLAALPCLGCGGGDAAPASGAGAAEAAASGAGAAAAASGGSGPRALAALRPGPRDQAVLDLGELGEIRIELLPEIAPATVAHFVDLAERGFYDGTYFHRVIPGFMIQGGDPNTKDNDPRNDGKGGSKRVEDEFTDYPHRRGTVSMANTGYTNSSRSQFFIVHQDARELDGSYTAFGRVVSGMDVVDRITELELDTYGRYGPPNRPYPVNATVERLWIEPAGEREGGGEAVAAAGAG